MQATPHISALIIALIVCIVLLPISIPLFQLAIVVTVGLLIWRLVDSPSKYARIAWIGTILGMVFLILGTTFFMRGEPPRNDFLPFYLAAKDMGMGHSSYFSLAAQATQESLAQNQIPMPFIRLPFYALLLRPLASLSYQHAYVVWQTISVALFVISGALATRRYRAAPVAFAWSLPMASAFVRGQDIALILFVIVVSLYLFEKRRPLGAGIVLSLCLLKWNLFLALPIFLLTCRSRRLIWGFTIGTVVLIALSFIVAGPSWPTQYVALLRYAYITPHLANMPNLRGMLFGLLSGPAALWIVVLLSAAVLALDWIIVARAASPYYAMAATGVAGILITPHSYAYDCVLLTPFLVAVAYQSEGRWLRFLAVLLLTPVLSMLLNSSVWHEAGGLSLLLFLALMAREVVGNSNRARTNVTPAVGVAHEF